MLKKITAIILSYLMFINASLATTVNDEKKIQSILDRLDYRLNVEWNQQDRVQLNSILNEYKNSIDSDSSINTDKFLEVFSNRLTNSTDSKVLKNIVSKIKSENLSIEETQSLLDNYLLENSASGSSFLGNVRFSINPSLVLLVVVLTVVLIVNNNRSDTDESTLTEEEKEKRIENAIRNGDRLSDRYDFEF